MEICDRSLQVAFLDDLWMLVFTTHLESEINYQNIHFKYVCILFEINKFSIQSARKIFIKQIVRLVLIVI